MAAQKRIEEVMKQNQEVEKFNDEVLKMQSKVRIVVRNAIPEGSLPEVALMKISNFREAKPEEASPDPVRSASEIRSNARESVMSEHHEGASLENFQLEEIPTKMILVEQRHSEDTHVIAIHSGRS